jgi:hypothetical protein
MSRTQTREENKSQRKHTQEKAIEEQQQQVKQQSGRTQHNIITDNMRQNQENAREE